LKDHTIIFVPHTRARFRKVRLSSRQLISVAVGVLLLAAISAFTTWSYFTNTVDRGEFARIRAENEQLRLTNRSFEASINELERQLDEYEERTRQLAIVAGLDSLESTPDTGIGGASTYGSGLDALSYRTDALGANLSQIGDRLDENLRWRDSMPTTAPVRGVMTSGFGYRNDPISGRRASHQGVDISTAPGRQVLAPAPGLVVKAGRIGGLGNAVVVSHGYGISTRYGHLSRIDVVAGQRVEEGETLGLVGSTGKSTGYHLHYEVRENGRPVNPIYYLLDWPRATGS
jgi:murein DD-endopeptidase MepM/ murein hydrolase activator NlpD